MKLSLLTLCSWKEIQRERGREGGGGRAGGREEGREGGRGGGAHNCIKCTLIDTAKLLQVVEIKDNRSRILRDEIYTLTHTLHEGNMIADYLRVIPISHILLLWPPMTTTIARNQDGGSYSTLIC